MKGITRIVIKGYLDNEWKNHFEGMKFSYEAGCTILSGNLKDDAHLHGVLNIIRERKSTPIIKKSYFPVI